MYNKRIREKDMGIILASKSPRRMELLKRITEDFTVVAGSVEESAVKETDPVRFAVEAAVLKAKDVGSRHPQDIIIGADTVVALDREIIGKPKDRDDAKRTLGLLSGTKHKVITGLAIYKKEDDRLLTGYEISRVQFRNLTEEEIEEYLSKNEYMDKAGAYAIQEIGDRFVEKIKGDYDNIVGLPVNRLKKLLDRFLLPEVETEITDVAFPKKWAVGRTEGKVVFIPGAVYGDRVKVRLIDKKSRNYSYGEVASVVQPSPYRTEPACPHFGTCGGCAFQDLKYEKQTELKERYFLTTLRRIGGIDAEGVEVHPIIHSPDTFYYRSKMEFAFGADGGRVSLGLRERSSPFTVYSKENVPLRECLIFSRAVKEIFPVFLELAQETELGAYDPRSGKGFFRHLVLREGKNTGELMAILVTKSGQIPDMTGLAAGLKEKVHSLWWVENDRVSDVVSFEKKHHLYGRQYIEERMEDLKFRIYPQSFFQPNTRAAQVLYGKIGENVKELAAGNRKVLGLYCGTGAIEIFLSGWAGEVTGVDSEQANINNAEENCKLNRIANCRFYRGYVEDVLKGDSSVGRDAGVVIVDPPRAGLSGKALKNVLAVDSPAIIYVSCNPAAFARDSAELKAGGYRLKRLYCADFFPHTTHMEGMGVFVKL